MISMATFKKSVDSSSSGSPDGGPLTGVKHDFTATAMCTPAGVGVCAVCGSATSAISTSALLPAPAALAVVSALSKASAMPVCAAEVLGLGDARVRVPSSTMPKLPFPRTAPVERVGSPLENPLGSPLVCPLVCPLGCPLGCPLMVCCVCVLGCAGRLQPEPRNEYLIPSMTT